MPESSQQSSKKTNAVKMKFFYLLVSLCIGFLLWSPLVKAQAPSIATQAPTPPTVPGSGGADPPIGGPPNAPTTIAGPKDSTDVPIYGVKFEDQDVY